MTAIHGAASLSVTAFNIETEPTPDAIAAMQRLLDGARLPELPTRDA
jgi:hypothetical protein